MELATLTIFLSASFALNMAPGPNNLLSVSNATRYGYRTPCLAGIGRLLGFAGMIALASAGLAVVLQTSELLFYGIKVLGAAYLFYLAYQLWRANPQAEVESAGARVGLWGLARQEFLVPAGKPNDGQDKHIFEYAWACPPAAYAMKLVIQSSASTSLHIRSADHQIMDWSPSTWTA